MRRRLGAALLAAAALAALGCGNSAANTVAPRAPGLPRCAPTSARMVRTDPQAQVYVLRAAVYGCDRRTRRSTKLGNTTACIAAARVDRTALGGNIVAYGVDRCGVDAGYTTVIVRRLSDGKRLRSYSAVSGPGLPESYQSIGSIVVKRDASVAWIGSEHSIIRQGSLIEVNRAQHGTRTTLGSGASIKPGSLKLTGSTLSWRDGDLTRSATLG